MKLCFVCQLKKATKKAKTQKGFVIELCDICFPFAVHDWKLRETKELNFERLNQNERMGK